MIIVVTEKVIHNCDATHASIEYSRLWLWKGKRAVAVFDSSEWKYCYTPHGSDAELMSLRPQIRIGAA